MTSPAEAVAAADDTKAAGWRSAVSRFEQVAAAHPDRPALVCDGDVLTFGELAARSAAVAAGLAGRGIGAESLVGLLMPRGFDLVVGLLGTLRAGAGYLPLDPALPIGRLRYMCEQAGTALVLSDAATRRRVSPALARQILSVDTCARVATGGPSRRAAIRPGQRAYAIYTSGSTGLPKGVEVTHGSLASLLDGLASVTGPVPARVGWNASPSFDASVQQWSRLCRGDTVVLIGDHVRSDPQALAALIAEERLDELDITPSHVVSLLEYLPKERGGAPLRLLVGGEAVTPALWRRLADQRAAGVLAPVNLYGPTECTVDATCARIDHASRPHLGDPLPGVRVHLLDEKLRPVPPEVEGELYVAGAGVSRGYLGMPGLTAQRFVPDVVAGDGGRMYRTGDRARIGQDGRLEFLGRCDDQVKLRGYRIELGEVEAVLSRCPGVVQGVALVRDDMPGGAGLVGYCRLERAAAGFDAEEVRRVAAEHLPEYMVPAVLVALERFPLTRNGKVDRAALPPPARPESADREATAPRTPTERLIADAWREVLQVELVGADDNFFELGGQSLLAIRLVAHLRRQAGRAIPLVAVFKHPVLRELAAHFDAEWSGTAPPLSEP
ncbi:non-ribosomal peptide synthetase [Nonomuraea basaltis]|uniref:non-ribosomal peptide synthetase n=1 Tax=Nonomuraea basaltis TaxID=2495887 RepID=UPI00110C590C|nr:non-ribosomal peptide synthetase [Nonomuraea basaltis]TMR99674.1 amino acid adenylation domain-containing protein [Nonomuraea basaltis]